jgi:hypothetical protein
MRGITIPIELDLLALRVWRKQPAHAKPSVDVWRVHGHLMVSNAHSLRHFGSVDKQKRLTRRTAWKNPKFHRVHAVKRPLRKTNSQIRYSSRLVNAANLRSLEAGSSRCADREAGEACMGQGPGPLPGRGRGALVGYGVKPRVAQAPIKK